MGRNRKDWVIVITVDITDAIIGRYVADTGIYNYMRIRFKRLKTMYVENFVFLLLRNATPLSIYHIIGNTSRESVYSTQALKSIVKETAVNTFSTHNKKDFDSDNNIRPEVYKEVRDRIIEFIELYERDIDYDEIETETIDGKQYFILTDDLSYEKYRKWFCDEKEHNIRYNFFKKHRQKGIRHDLFLQKMEIDIVSEPVEFDYPVEYTYVCNKQLNNPHVTKKKLYETISVKHKIECEFLIPNIDREGNERPKMCKTILKPDETISQQKPCYYYRVIYDSEEGKKVYVDGYSFNKYQPGKYMSAFFIIHKSFDRPNFHIVDVKRLKDNVFTIPEKKEGENFILTLINSIDKFIKRKTETLIWGLLPIKVSLIIQAAKNYIDTKLDGNIQIVGQTSTGKTLVLKRYGYFIYGGMFKTTSPQSVSIPALRGTNRTMNFFGASIKMPVLGLLGSYRCLHIDEMGEDKTLLSHMKTFLLENSYSYDKSDSEGATQKRLAHVNVSENIGQEYRAIYFSGIKKAYKAYTSQITDIEKVTWSDDWDLYKPLTEYPNPYLLRMIREKREQCGAKEEFWIDGYPISVHNRFPFYFYLVNENEEGNDKLIDTVLATDETLEKDDDHSLLRVLKNGEISVFFEGLKEFIKSKHDKEIGARVKTIVKEYNMKADLRQLKFFFSIVKMSRIINQRETVEEMDYDILKYIIENTNCKIDVINTCEFVLRGPSSNEKMKELDDKMDKASDKFSVQMDDVGGVVI